MEHLNENRILFFWNDHKIFIVFFFLNQLQAKVWVPDMNSFRCNGSIIKRIHSKQASPAWSELKSHTVMATVTRWVAFPSQPGELLQLAHSWDLEEKAHQGHGWTGYMGTLWKQPSEKKCANSVILSIKHGSLRKNRALFLIKNNQRTIYMGVRTSTDGAKSKPGTFNCLFDLWWLTLC